MRIPFFRILLTGAQAALTIALVLHNVNFGAHEFRTVSNCDIDSSHYCGPPPLPEVFSQFAELNLPVLPIAILPWLDLGESDYRNLPLLYALYGFLGIGIWFHAGQFLDNLAASFTNKLRLRRHIYDRLFSGFIILSSCFVLFASG